MTEPETDADTWYAANAPAVPARRRLGIDLDVDVCVVGGGLAGLTVARELALRGWSVALLEGKRIAWNASGRNAGFVLPGFSQSEERIIARVGLDHAKALWRLSEEGVDYVRKTIRAEKMRSADPVSGWLQVSKSDAPEETARQRTLLRRSFGAEVEAWPTEKLRAVLKTDRYFQALHFPRALHINPLNYALGLAAAAEAAGARIYEETPVLSIDPAGIRKRIVTPQARLRAQHVVLAGNVHLGRVAPRVSETLLPVWTYILVSEPLGERLGDAIAYRGAVSDGARADNHYRIVGGDRLLWSGRVTTWEANPAGRVRALRAALKRVYPQLGDVSFSHAWTGALGRPVHGMPQIGELSPGIWLASGFAGHGLNTTAMAGTLLARAIVDRDDAWRQFLPFELVWAGGMPGRAAAQAFYWGARVRERMAEPAARLSALLRRSEPVVESESLAPAAEPVPEELTAQEVQPTAADPKRPPRKRGTATVPASKPPARRRKKDTAPAEPEQPPELAPDETV